MNSGAHEQVKAVMRSLERVPIRTRESGVTQSAWQMTIDSDFGAGAITLLDLGSGHSLYRGDGAFLGWPQAQLAATYQGLIGKSEEPPFALQQLG